MNIILSRPLTSLTRRFGITKHPHELEGILRPPLELYSSAVALGAAALFFVIPELFMLSALYGFMVGASLALFGLRRLFQGIYCMQYKLIINNCPVYKISVDDICTLDKFYSLRSI